MRKYRGKYPSRIHTVYSGTVLGKRVLFARTNDGKRFLISPRTAGDNMPKPGQEIGVCVAVPLQD